MWKFCIAFQVLFVALSQAQYTINERGYDLNLPPLHNPFIYDGRQHVSDDPQFFSYAYQIPIEGYSLGQPVTFLPYYHQVRQISCFRHLDCLFNGRCHGLQTEMCSLFKRITASTAEQAETERIAVITDGNITTNPEEEQESTEIVHTTTVMSLLGSTDYETTFEEPETTEVVQTSTIETTPAESNELTTSVTVSENAESGDEDYVTMTTEF